MAKGKSMNKFTVNEKQRERRRSKRETRLRIFFLGFIRFRFKPVLMFQASVPAFKVSSDSNLRFETISNFQSLAEVVERFAELARN